MYNIKNQRTSVDFFVVGIVEIKNKIIHVIVLCKEKPPTRHLERNVA